MTAKSKNLNELLICKVCKKYYLNPVFLPCQNNVCEKHVQEKIKDNDSKTYKFDWCFKLFFILLYIRNATL